MKGQTVMQPVTKMKTLCPKSPMAPVRKVSSRVYLSAYSLNPQNTIHFTSLYVALRLWRNRVNCIVLPSNNGFSWV